MIKTGNGGDTQIIYRTEHIQELLLDTLPCTCIPLNSSLFKKVTLFPLQEFSNGPMAAAARENL